MANILSDVVFWLFNILQGLLFVRVILTWLPMIRGGRLVEFVFAFTEPFLAPIRKLIERSPLGGPGMMLDFSPIVAFILLRLISSFLLSLIAGIGV